MVAKTRRVKKHSGPKPMSILQLRRAFEHIDRFVDSKVSKLSEKEGLAAFCKEWKKTFGKEVSQVIAKDYLHFVSVNKRRAQKGGAYSPAPLGYDLTTPTNGTVSVPAYATYAASGMSPMASVNQDSFTSGCGAPSAFTGPSPDMGSNAFEPTKGGRRRKTRRGNKRQRGGAQITGAMYEFLSRPVGMNSPPGTAQDLQMLSKGYNAFPSPRPEINPVTTPYNPVIYNASINPITRQF